MFLRFTQLPDGGPIYVRESRVLAFAASDDGTRIFLSGGFSCLVEEDHKAVLKAFTPADDGR